MSFQVHAGNMGMILYVCIQGQLQQFAVDLISLRSGAPQEAVGCVWFSARRCSLSLRGLTRDRKQLSITGNCYKLPLVCICRSLGSSVLVGWKPHKHRKCSSLSYAIPRYSSKDHYKSCYVPGNVHRRQKNLIFGCKKWLGQRQYCFLVDIGKLVVKVRYIRTYIRFSSCLNPSLNFKCNVMLCFFLFIYLKRVLYMFFVVYSICIIRLRRF